MCKRGDIYWAEIPKQENSQNQAGYRPVLIIANDMATLHSPTFQCVPLTGTIKKEDFPTHVILTSGGLSRKTMALVEQVTSYDRYMLKERIGTISESDMREINNAIMIQLGLIEVCNAADKLRKKKLG